MHPGDLQREVIAMIPRLRRMARTLALNTHDADDLVQETCIRALTGAAGFRPGARLDTWLFTILRNQWVTELRRAATRRGRGTIDAAEADDLHHSDDGAAHMAAGDVRDAILALPRVWPARSCWCQSKGIPTARRPSSSTFRSAR